MADVLTPEQRSRCMAAIKGKNTKPEIVVRSLLDKLKVKYELHRSDLPGKPDIVLSRRKKIIFVHGCFWHRHAGCRFAYTPKSRKKFWLAKFAANIARDIKASRALRQLGWKPVIVWECEIGN